MNTSIMTDRLTNQDNVSELLTDIEDIYEQYKASSQYQIAEYEKQVQDYRTQLALVDGVRETYFEPYIQSLYQLLSLVGSPSRKLNKLPLISEMVKENAVKRDLVFLIYERAVTALKREEEQHQTILLWILQRVRLNTVKLSKGQKAKSRLKREIKRQQLLIEDKQKQMNQAIELAKLYRDVLMVAKEAVEQSILPELKAVRALLTALDVAENVTMNRAEHIPGTWPVLCLNNTEYQTHYQFVKGTFAYYHLLLELYESPVAMKLSGGTSMEQKEIQQFMELKDSLIRQQEEVMKSLVFYC